MLHVVLIGTFGALPACTGKSIKLDMPKRKEGENKQDDKCKQTPDDSTARDHSERRYYYDDAHGYEDFDPEAELAEDDDD